MIKTPWICLFCFLFSAISYAGNVVQVYGEARDIHSKALLYTEEHRINTTTHKVTYRQVDGTLIADKNIQYTQGYATPSFQLYDHRFGRTSGSKWQEGNWLLWQQDKSGKRDEKGFDPEQNLVIDAGFNYFVLENFKALEEGKALDFTFAITDPPMEIPMTIKKKSCTDAVFFSTDENVLCLKIVSHNFLFRIFVPVIYLAYIHNPENDITHLLSLYQGPSNLPDNDDKAQTVRITYRYEFQPETSP